MHTSMYISPRSRRADEQGALLDLIEELSLVADDAGFASVVFTEHHVGTHNPFQNPLTYASHLAAKLTQAYVAMCTVNPTLHNPLRLVEQCNLLDLLTNGRLLIGVGSGFVDDEYLAFGRDPDQRAELFQQSISVLMDLWAYGDGQAPYEFRTLAEHGRITRAVTPSSYRRPHPLLARATLSEHTLLDTARRGWSALVSLWNAQDTGKRLQPYFEMLESSGHDIETIAQCRKWTGTMKWVHVAETDEQAWRELEPTIDRWSSDQIHRGKDALRSVSETSTPEIRGALAKGGPEAERAALAQQYICGSPNTVAAAFREYEEAGVGHLLAMFLRDLAEAPAVRRSMNLFIDEVLPQFERAGKQGHITTHVASR